MSQNDFVIKDGVLEGYNGTDEEITIPSEVKEIASFACCKNDKLKSVIIPNSVVTIGDSAFKDCFNLEKVVIGNGINIIKPNAFENCSKLTEVIMPTNLEYISSKAFANTGIRYIWQNNNRCATCGGKFKGLIKPKCSNCLRYKDY